MNGLPINRRAVLAGAVSLSALALGAASAVAAEEPGRLDALNRLIELIVARLDVMPDVARNKYNSGAAVEDAPREAQVLALVASQAAQAGVPRNFAERFFQAQIDAAKMLQQARIDLWKNQNQSLFADVPDLARDIRPKLDALTPQFIAALLSFAPLFAEPAVKTQLENAAASFALVRPQDAAAFRRALAPLGLGN